MAKKRKARLSWFRLDVDAFLEDPRMQFLTNKEKAFWALLLIRSFRNGGVVVTSPQVIAEQTGCTQKEAKELLGKLLDPERQLLIPSGKMYEACSPRLVEEHRIATESYERYSNLGKQSADKNGTANLKLVK